MAQQKPEKPPRKSKRLKLALTEQAKWKQILKEVEVPEAPISVLQTITVKLIDGTEVEIDVQALLEDGISPEDLEEEINEKLESLDDVIENVDFFISVEHVAKAVQPITDSILKNL
jgi:hypothetical protein